jgi:hypothetical protein
VARPLLEDDETATWLRDFVPTSTREAAIAELKVGSLPGDERWLKHLQTAPKPDFDAYIQKRRAELQQVQGLETTPQPQGFWQDIKTGAASLGKSAVDVITSPIETAKEVGSFYGDLVPQPRPAPTPAPVAAKPAFNEPAFQEWYGGHAATQGLNPNPDDPQHFYDYRGAYTAGATPDASGHWPSRFKLPEHPNRFVTQSGQMIDTITGNPVEEPAPTIDKNAIPTTRVTGQAIEQPEVLRPTVQVPGLPTPQRQGPASPQSLENFTFSVAQAVNSGGANLLRSLSAQLDAITMSRQEAGEGPLPDILTRLPEATRRRMAEDPRIPEFSQILNSYADGLEKYLPAKTNRQSGATTSTQDALDIADRVASGLAGFAAEYGIPLSAVTKGLTALGMVGKTAATVAPGIVGFTKGAEESPAEAAKTAALFTVPGVVGQVTRPLGKAVHVAAQTATGAAYGAAFGDDWKDVVSMAAMFGIPTAAMEGVRARWESQAGEPTKQYNAKAFEFFGLDPDTATDADVKAAYRNAVKSMRPDLVDPDPKAQAAKTKAFMDLTEAYNTALKAAQKGGRTVQPPGQPEGQEPPNPAESGRRAETDSGSVKQITGTVPGIEAPPPAAGPEARPPRVGDQVNARAKAEVAAIPPELAPVQREPFLKKRADRVSDIQPTPVPGLPAPQTEQGVAPANEPTTGLPAGWEHGAVPGESTYIWAGGNPEKPKAMVIERDDGQFEAWDIRGKDTLGTYPSMEEAAAAAEANFTVGKGQTANEALSPKKYATPNEAARGLFGRPYNGLSDEQKKQVQDALTMPAGSGSAPSKEEPKPEVKAERPAAPGFPIPKQEIKSIKTLAFKELPESAQNAIGYTELGRKTNKNEDAHLTDSQWEQARVPIESLRKGNEMLWDGAEFVPRGSMTNGPIVLDHAGEVIDGNNRLYEAIQRGDEGIQVYRPVAKKTPEEPKPEAPKAEHHAAPGLPSPERPTVADKPPPGGWKDEDKAPTGDFRQDLYRKHKRALTKAENAGDPYRIIEVAQAGLDDFETHGYPDDWARWERAIEDAKYKLAHHPDEYPQKAEAQTPGLVPETKTVPTANPADMTKDEFLAAGWTARRTGKEWNIYRPDGSKWGFMPGTPDRPIGSEKSALDAFYDSQVKASEPKTPSPTTPSLPAPKPAMTDQEKADLLTKGGRGAVLPDEPTIPAVEAPATTEQKIVGASMNIAYFVEERLKEDTAPGVLSFSMDQLVTRANEDFGGTQADGTYTVKDLNDALELGINRFIGEMLGPDGVYRPTTYSLIKAREMLNYLREQIMDKIPSQGTRRTPEMVEFQQFSTPPDLAFVMNWAAHITPKDVMLEPSAGLGGLAIFAKNFGADVDVNELSPRRAGLLNTIVFNKVTTENAEQIANILKVTPTVIVMNPPFSSTAGRITGERKSTNAISKHIDQALKLLAPNGRLVALIGEGFMGQSEGVSRAIDALAKKYQLRASVVMSGKGYKKYGTDFDNRILIFDKVAPSPSVEVVTGKAENPYEALNLLKEVRDDRPSVEGQATRPDEQRPPAQRGGQAVAEGGGGQTGPGSAVPVPTGDVGTRPRPVDHTAGGGQRHPATETGRPPRVPGRKEGAGVVPQQPREPGLPVAGGERPIQGHEPKAGGGEGTGGPRPAPAGRPADEGNVPAHIPVQSGITVVASSEPESKFPSTTKELTDAVYDEYQPPKVRIPGAKPHPGKLVESAAMADTLPPDPTYTPNLPQDLIDSGALSLAQLETPVYAGQAHELFLSDGTRKGFFLGDGTGVGKGRQISAVILDNFRNGREKAIWVSESSRLIADAKRDWVDIGGDKGQVFELGKTKLGEPIDQPKGIMFTTYATIRSNLMTDKTGKVIPITDKKTNQPKQSRVNQILAWLGKDFDGVIVFDEAHNMQKTTQSMGARGIHQQASIQALAALDLRKQVPKARIVYASATGANSVDTLGYAERLGLWGPGTAFPDQNDFSAKITEGGLGAMEVVARDMKAMGVYIARSLDFSEVTYSTLEHVLTPEQEDIYNGLARAWQVVLANINQALELTGVTEGGKAKNAGAKSTLLSNFWGTELRFFNQVLTAMQMPTVIADMEAKIKDGKAIIAQLVNTNEAGMERQIQNAEQEDGDLENLDLTPRDALMQFLEKSFPTQQYEQYQDEQGNIRSRPVLDHDGNPVQNQDAIQLKQDMLLSVGSLKVPEGPLEFIINTFGPDAVAEVTGRSRRVVRLKDNLGREKTVIQSRSPSLAAHEVDEYLADKKSILVFSDAGGTGRSFHSDRRIKNQRQRWHYGVQPGWRAEKFIQGLGRSHRTNEANAPHYVLVMTNLKGHKRFISTIGRRLDQLGAMTKGERKTGSSGLINAKDNLENKYAQGAVRALVLDAHRGEVPTVDFKEMIEGKMGLTGLVADDGSINEDKIPKVPQFLNRILALEIHDQNAVFDAFSERMEQAIDHAASLGQLDVGLETYKARSVKTIKEQQVYRDPISGATTSMVSMDTKHDVNFVQTKEVEKKEGFQGYVQSNKTEKVFASVYTGTRTDPKTGGVNKHFRLISPVAETYYYVDEDGLSKHYAAINPDAGKALWKKTIDTHPPYREEPLHLISGTLLPIWDRLPQDHVRVMRVQDDTGKRYLGRVVREGDVSAVLRRLGASVDLPTLTPAQAMDTILKKRSKIALVNGWRFERKTVAGETRIEIVGNGVERAWKELEAAGAFREIIQFKTRIFIPTGEKGASAFEKIVANHPVAEIVDSEMGQGEITSHMKAFKTKFKRAGNVVDGRRVVGEASNQSSIKASLTKYEILDGVREVPISAFQDDGKPSFYSRTEKHKVEALANTIKESGEIEPLIVVEDGSKAGPYVLEGGHRFDALKLLGAKSFPAMVVLDTQYGRADVSYIKVVKEEGGHGAAAGIDPNRIKAMGEGLYSEHPSKVIVKELVQNATDGTRGLTDKAGAMVRIEVFPDDHKITIDDTGTGMLPDVAFKELVDFGGSKKTEDAAGMFGVAKVVIFAGADNIDIKTVAYDPARGMVETHLSGSGADWLNQEKGLTATIKAADPDATPGTRVRLKYPDKMEFDTPAIRKWLENVTAFHQMPLKLSASIGGLEINPEKNWKAMGVARTRTLEFQGGEVDFSAAEGTAEMETGKVQILNNGLYQFTINVSFGKGHKLKLPHTILANIRSRRTPGQTGYPFTTNREKLRGDVKDVIRKYLIQDLVTDALDVERETFRKAFEEAPDVPGTDFQFMDTEQTVPPEILKEMADQPHVKQLALMMARAFAPLQKALIPYGDQYGSVVFQGIGIGKYLGVNIGGSSIFKGDQSNYILINPYDIYQDVNGHVLNGRIPPENLAKEFAAMVISTAVHEISHQSVRPHNEAFAAINSYNQARTIKESAAALEVMLGDMGGPNGAKTLLAQIAADVDTLKPFQGEESHDVFEKISTGHERFRGRGLGAAHPEGGEGGGAQSQIPLPGRRQRPAQAVSSRAALPDRRAKRGQPVQGDTLTRAEFEDYLDTLPLKDSFGKLDYNDLHGISGYGDKWTLKAVNPKTLELTTETPTGKYPIIIDGEGGEALDGRRRQYAAINKGVKAILAWVPNEGISKMRRFNERGGVPLGKEVNEGPKPGWFRSANPTIDARVRKAKKGLQPISWKEWAKEHLKQVWRLTSREFEHLPDTAEFSRLRNDLLKLSKQKGIQADRIERELARIVKPLSPMQYDDLEWKALLTDLSHEAAKGNKLPFEYTPDSVTHDLERIDDRVQKDPAIRAAWAARKELWKGLTTDYKKAMDAIGFDVSKKLTKEDYFRHQVLDYAREQRLIAGSGKRLRTPTGRGFLKKREGSTFDINANYIQAEFEVMAQMAYDTQLAKVIKGVDEAHNIRQRLKGEARAANQQTLQKRIDAELAAPGGVSLIDVQMKHFRQRLGMHQHRLRDALDLQPADKLTMEQIQAIANDPESPGQMHALGIFKAIGERKAFIKGVLGKAYKTWQDLVPDGYTLWQPREGNIFYMADTIPAQLAKALHEHALEEVGLTKEMLRTMMAQGGPREQYVVKDEVAVTLDELAQPAPNWFVDLNRAALSHWKQVMLIAPRRVIGYNLRNLSGDSDALFVGNPGAFKKVQQAIKEMWPVMFKDEPLTGEAKEWAERGGYGSTLQVQEMGDLNELKAFRATIDREGKGGALALPVEAFNKYWKAARLGTDYREAMLRYAAYLDYLEQMQGNTEGRPANWGASRRETVMALPDIRDRAFKLSNELLGAYDRVSVAGQTLRRFWYPFWSWQEVNMGRYAHLLRNAFEDADYGAGARGAGVAGKKVAAFLIRAAALWTMLQVWNNFVFDDEERELQDTDPTIANRIHVILGGKREDGSIPVFTGLGALGDALSWFGLDQAPGLVGDYLHGRLTLGEIWQKTWHAPINKVWQGITPLVKDTVDLVGRINTYPDVFNPRPMQSRGDYLAQQATVGQEARALAGKPTKPYLGSDNLTGFLGIRKINPDQAAYQSWQDIEAKYKQRLGKDDGGLYWRTPKGEALQNIALSIKYGDTAAEAKYRAEYKELGGTSKTMHQSLRDKTPLWGLTKNDRDAVVKQLEPAERRILQRAENYYATTMLQVLPEGDRRAFIAKLKAHHWLTPAKPLLADLVPAGEGVFP